MMTPGGVTVDNGNGRLRDAQLEAKVERLSDKVADLQGSIEALRLEFMNHRGETGARLEHIGEMVHGNTSSLNKFCAVETLKWENHADLHSREHANLKTWSAIVSACTGFVAGILGWFGGPSG